MRDIWKFFKEDIQQLKTECLGKENAVSTRTKYLIAKQILKSSFLIQISGVLHFFPMRRCNNLLSLRNDLSFAIMSKNVNLLFSLSHPTIGFHYVFIFIYWLVLADAPAYTFVVQILYTLSFHLKVFITCHSARHVRVPKIL